MLDKSRCDEAAKCASTEYVELNRWGRGMQLIQVVCKKSERDAMDVKAHL